MCMQLILHLGILPESYRLSIGLADNVHALPNKLYRVGSRLGVGQSVFSSRTKLDIWPAFFS